jgi:hypothetical protein
MASRRRQSVTDAEPQRLNIRISPDSYRRLGVHAVMAGMSPGRLVEHLINTHCREWKVQANRTALVTPDDRQEADASVTPATHPAGL